MRRWLSKHEVPDSDPYAPPAHWPILIPTGPQSEAQHIPDLDYVPSKKVVIDYSARTPPSAVPSGETRKVDGELYAVCRLPDDHESLIDTVESLFSMSPSGSVGPYSSPDYVGRGQLSVSPPVMPFVDYDVDTSRKQAVKEGLEHGKETNKDSEMDRAPYEATPSPPARWGLCEPITSHLSDKASVSPTSTDERQWDERCQAEMRGKETSEHQTSNRHTIAESSPFEEAQRPPWFGCTVRQRYEEVIEDSSSGEDEIVSLVNLL
ncbi:hypothetical protein QFC24_004471 [Naganishia onofrii]|uniref:Uncharacterized protein n=1 Tax=Naganishia onofrii TaxID=1851511 RepID=A0ACC2XES5_9TREE|nr:hypothetical protein QFC24_004471 [Naganishia onofrii]